MTTSELSKNTRHNDQIYELLCSILEQAISDYRQLAAAGYVDRGRIAPIAEILKGKKTAFGMTKIDIQDLIRFLNSPSFDRLCREGVRIEIDPVAVRDRLGLPSRGIND